jgi:hypothetical protein
MVESGNSSAIGPALPFGDHHSPIHGGYAVEESLVDRVLVPRAITFKLAQRARAPVAILFTVGSIGRGSVAATTVSIGCFRRRVQCPMSSPAHLRLGSDMESFESIRRPPDGSDNSRGPDRPGAGRLNQRTVSRETTGKP